MALEARYLPLLARGMIHLANAEMAEWDAFADQFDPRITLKRIGWTPDDLLTSADRLLVWLRQSDPLTHHWSELVRRAPQSTWAHLQGDALAAIDKRIAAEILLRCYEDLADRGSVQPITARMDAFQAERERISHRGQSLDANLSSLGISPHPGVVLVIEGETEELIVPRVREHIRIPHDAQVIQSVVLRGVGHDISKLAAFACAPLIERRQGDDWLLVKPPTHLVVIVDPDSPFDTPEGVRDQRRKILDEITAVVRAQGVDPEREDLEPLVDLSTWSESCFEFAHFSDAELADALLSVHSNCNGLDRRTLVNALAQQRGHRQDIKNVWINWRNQPTKPALAEALWPTLRRKLDDAAASSTIEPPPIALFLIDAFRKAALRPSGRFILRGVALPDHNGHAVR